MTNFSGKVTFVYLLATKPILDGLHFSGKEKIAI